MTEYKLSEQEIKDKTKQSLLWFTTVPFFMQLLRFANSLLLARILSPEDFGIIGVVSVILFYSNSFSDFGFNKSIVQRREIQSKHYDSYFTFNILMSLALFLIFQLFSENLAAYFEIIELQQALQVFAFMLIITAFLAVPQAKLRRELNFKTMALLEVFKVFTSMAISLTLALNGFKFWSIIYATLISQFLLLILMLIFAKIVPRPYFGLLYLKQLVHFGKWDFLGGQVSTIAENVDKLIIGKVLGAPQLGFYDRALGIAKMPYDNISLKIGNISFSSFSRMQDNPEKIRCYFSKIMILNSVIIAPLLIGLALVSESFVMFVLGQKWQNTVDCLVIFSFVFLFGSLANPIFSINAAMNKIKAQTLICLVLTVTLVLLMVVFARFGIELIAFIILIFRLILLIASYWLMTNYIQVSWKMLISDLWPATLYSALMALGVLLLQYAIRDMLHWQIFLSSVVVGILIFACAFFFIPLKNVNFIRLKAVRAISQKFFKLRV